MFDTFKRLIKDYPHLCAFFGGCFLISWPFPTLWNLREIFLYLRDQGYLFHHLFHVVVWLVSIATALSIPAGSFLLVAAFVLALRRREKRFAQSRAIGDNLNHAPSELTSDLLDRN